VSTAELPDRTANAQLSTSIRRFGTAGAGLGEDWTPRELRHSFVSLMSDKGVPIETIADLVGHAGTRVTEKVYRNPRELHQMGEFLQVA
jgi:integrase